MALDCDGRKVQACTSMCACVCVWSATLESRVVEMTSKIASMQQQIEQLIVDRTGYKVCLLVRLSVSLFVCVGHVT